MRADRLVATLLLLQARGRVTAAEVAAELEVSARTARRDLEALAMAGVPVYSQAGRGGGWSLVGGARTDLSGLTAAEARTLFLVAGPSSAVTPEAKAALRKLVQALPETFRAEAEAAANAVILDPAAWGQAPPTPPKYLDVLQEAVVAGRQVELGYANRERSVSLRTVHPLGLVAKGQVWYLIGDTAAGLRTFRVGRVRSVTVTDRPALRPPGFDLAREWERVVATMDEQRTPYRATVLVEPRAVPWLRSRFANRLQEGEPQADGRIACTVDGWSVGSIAGDLLSFGPNVEAVAPQEVRDTLASWGRDLVDRYGSPAPVAAP